MSPPARPSREDLAARIDAALPQTQCTRCGYPDCAAYARAVAASDAEINRCPPGGAEGVARLAAITGRPPIPLDPQCGTEGPRTVAVIDENWCIGCTLCIKACPTDAILGTHKYMHTVIEPHCTGCELCIPVCPVDCIVLEPASGAQTGWAAWSLPQAEHARHRYQVHQARLGSAECSETPAEPPAQESRRSLAAAAPAPSPGSLDSDTDAAAARRAAVAAALARARQKRTPGTPG
ncbi:electron transport complex subunit RsxB [Acidovorax sp. GBBC 3334]|uniref:electron transport complex subunit RsxB n=1 Tax=Acidovorax sp. GBBC 3334 TaxID=2940496 RepID=UPI0023042E9E|nr:electron transport complex subunit RsxB [Acidovorax sp. GBBC 3334]MDA8457415.1 electron transport complex subunit RsxB [Acidovorax sp. GBBC 3334]